jgi:predicted TIM-barrel fold metal-dependent hydrolase
MGLSGVKIHPRTQQVDVCDERWHELFCLLAERRVPVMIDGYCQTSGALRWKHSPRGTTTPWRSDTPRCPSSFRIWVVTA